MFINHFFRLFFILRTINRHGGLYILRGMVPNFLFILFRPFIVKKQGKENGEIIRGIMHDLGPVFIKFGQALSTRSDLIGDDIARELAHLQDRVPPMKKNYIDLEIKHNFGQEVAEIFQEFDREVIAAASIAEVFKAKTKDGKSVAVKILKPGIKKEFERDIKFFKWAAGIIEQLFPKSRRLKPLEVVYSFEKFTKMELDLRLEAAAASRLKTIHHGDKDIYIPQIHWHLTTANILTLELIDGIKIYNLKNLEEHNHDLKKLSEVVILMFLKQAFESGYFHADLHPGNIFVNSKGQVVLLDFGIMGHLDSKTKLYIAEILYGFMKRDYDYVAKVHFEAGYVPKDQSFMAFSQACRAIGEPIIDLPVSRISIAKLLAQLFKTTKDFEMETQTQLLLLQKTMVMVEGLAVKLNPQVNMWEVARPFVENWAKLNMSFDAKIVNKFYDITEKFEDLLEAFKKDSNKAMNPSIKNNYKILAWGNLILIIMVLYLAFR